MFARIVPYLLLTQIAAAALSPIEFKQADRVVLVGNTFIERSQAYGHLETMLSAAMPDRDLSFRNLGWSGDTVFGDARSYFGPPAEGFERLTKHLDELKPTLIIACYGAVAAFEGEDGLTTFTAGYGTLLDMFAKTGARIVLMSPPPAETLPPPLPDQEAHNERLALYRDAIRTLAEKRDHGFADVFGGLREHWESLPRPLTENGIHYTDQGYQAITPIIAKKLGVEPEAASIAITLPAGDGQATQGTLDQVTPNDRGLTFRWLPKSLSSLPLTLRVEGLAEGSYKVLQGGNDTLCESSAAELAKGITLSSEESQPHLATLRKTIHRKNELFFHKWRPQNETYLFGFRKHEQGNNAVEIPQFEPLIQAQEAKIRNLLSPSPLTLTLKR